MISGGVDEELVEVRAVVGLMVVGMVMLLLRAASSREGRGRGDRVTGGTRRRRRVILFHMGRWRGESFLKHRRVELYRRWRRIEPGIARAERLSVGACVEFRTSVEVGNVGKSVESTEYHACHDAEVWFWVGFEEDDGEEGDGGGYAAGSEGLIREGAKEAGSRREENRRGRGTVRMHS
jgi:hypothetical protein